VFFEQSQAEKYAVTLFRQANTRVPWAIGGACPVPEFLGST